MPKIRHGCLLNVNYEEGSLKFKELFDEARKMSDAIPMVKEYHQYKQTDDACPYGYGFIQEFNSVEDYQKFFEHPKHIEYGEKYWAAGAKDFMDINFIEFD